MKTLIGSTLAIAIGVGSGCGDNAKAPGDASVRDAAADGPSLPVVANPPASACGAPDAATLQHANVAQGHCAWVFASGLGTPRGEYVDASGDVLVVETANGGQITALFDANGDRVSDASERAVLVPSTAGLGLNHGIWVHDGYLYASSATTVYRWPYVAGTRTTLGAPEVVVQGMPTGGHGTRTLKALDGDHWLYVSIGSGSNLDADSSRARVMRYDLTSIPAGGYVWTAGEVFADGLRNEVGLAFDPGGRLWGVQNGMDNLARDDLGGDIHDGNPAEIVSLFAQPGRFYGYPYCWNEYALPAGVGRGPGTPWATPATMNDGTHDDAWCRDPANVVAPALAMVSHAAPLGMVFYEGDAFVALHGSWDRTPPSGYEVVRLIFADATHIASYEPFLQYEGPGATGTDWPHRPVDVAVAQDGVLLVTSDASGLVIAIAKTR